MAESAATKFFYKHAGYSYPSGATTKQQETARWQNARKMATAEQYATDQGWYYEWNHDPDPDISWMDEEALADYEAGRTEMLEVLLKDENGKVLESLGGVHVRASADRDPYTRVVEAELALEAMPSNNPAWSRVFG